MMTHRFLCTFIHNIIPFVLGCVALVLVDETAGVTVGGGGDGTNVELGPCVIDGTKMEAFRIS